jgi:hypothetical protein
MNQLPLHPDVAQENQRALAAAIQQLAAELRNWVDEGRTGRIDELVAGHVPLQLERITTLFHLSPFESRVLLSAAAVEIDGTFATLCAAAHADERMAYPTFQLMLSAFADAHWDALSPSAALRSWKLINLVSGDTIAASRIRIDERILHFLLGVPCENASLAGVWQPVLSGAAPLPASQAAMSEQIAGLLVPTEARLPLALQVLGADAPTRQAVAAAAAAASGLQLGRIVSHLLPSAAPELHATARLLEREAILAGQVIFISIDDSEAVEPGRMAPVTTLIESISSPVIVSADDPLRFPTRETMLFELKKPIAAEQTGLWRAALGQRAASLNGTLDSLSAHFNLSSEAIYRNSAMAITLAGSNTHNGHDKDLSETLWNICRVQSRVRLDKMAQRVEADAGWDDLVLPDNEIRTLRTIAQQMQHRLQVHDRWGFRSPSGRGMGLSAIFAGISGTGKTTAAEVLAKELNLDLFRVDLSHTVSKYIGETSRNLRRIFDVAEEAGAILLFDEADALFGKRSEVRDSHDRYANAEVSYLLQRMELYRGLAVLATNMKQAIDQAFMRRVRFVVQFPLPDATMREAIWRRALPAAAPTEAINFHALARLSVTGANIRNIALNGAFLAAEEDQPIRMSHLLQAAHSEADKLERSVPEGEIRGWV